LLWRRNDHQRNKKNKMGFEETCFNIANGVECLS
jgi:hypothetical protein